MSIEGIPQMLFGTESLSAQLHGGPFDLCCVVHNVCTCIQYQLQLTSLRVFELLCDEDIEGVCLYMCEVMGWKKPMYILVSA